MSGFLLRCVTLLLAIALAACTTTQPNSTDGRSASISRPVGQVLDDTRTKLALVHRLSQSRHSGNLILNTKQRVAPAHGESFVWIGALGQAFVDEDQTTFQDVGTVVYQGRVLLIGTVDDQAAKQRIGEIAMARAGVREVLNEVQVTEEDTFSGFVNDSIITKRIQLKFFWDEHIDSSNIKIRSVNGVVYLIGLAGTRSEYERAVSIASDTEDVRRVVNYLSVRS